MDLFLTGPGKTYIFLSDWKRMWTVILKEIRNLSLTAYTSSNLIFSKILYIKYATQASKYCSMLVLERATVSEIQVCKLHLAQFSSWNHLNPFDTIGFSATLWPPGSYMALGGTMGPYLA